jgi:hypothetical protein
MLAAPRADCVTRAILVRIDTAEPSQSLRPGNAIGGPMRRSVSFIEGGECARNGFQY